MEGEHVYLSHGDELHVPALVVSASGTELTVRTANGRSLTVEAGSAERVMPGSCEGVDDVLLLHDVSEASMLHTLRTRFRRQQCFTSVGSILIFCNPRSWVRGEYDAAAAARYRRAVPGDSLPPHLFAVARESVAALVRDGRCQHIVIGGESGAGKTESTKIVLSYLMGCDEGDGGSSGEGGRAALQRFLLQSSPLLEAFGNAKTAGSRWKLPPALL